MCRANERRQQTLILSWSVSGSLSSFSLTTELTSANTGAYGSNPGKIPRDCPRGLQWGREHGATSRAPFPAPHCLCFAGVSSSSKPASSRPLPNTETPGTLVLRGHLPPGRSWGSGARHFLLCRRVWGWGLHTDRQSLNWASTEQGRM